jgi:hypothetical protein
LFIGSVSHGESKECGRYDRDEELIGATEYRSDGTVFIDVSVEGRAR